MKISLNTFKVTSTKLAQQKAARFAEHNKSQTNIMTSEVGNHIKSFSNKTKNQNITSTKLAEQKANSLRYF